MSRELTNFRRVRALIETLHSNGVITDAERSALLEGDKERQKDVERSAREGRGPPDWARGPDRSNGEGQ
ncbi:hypothetical protein [Haloplanus salinarum]|uniref:hypothetical protein n=1 Tax=Haloplanus salinarum TaxID=1912324 RepID=UPI00214C9A81|nr:hypothetical protein [Haloplanus salinarum]